MIDAKITHDFEFQDALDGYIYATRHYESCYEALERDTKDNPYLLDLTDAIVEHCKAFTEAKVFLEGYGISDAELIALAVRRDK